MSLILQQVAGRFGVSTSLVRGWMGANVAVDDVREGTHYVACRVCGQGSVKITQAHLKLHDLNLTSYRLRYPEAPMQSEMCGKIRPKTPEQKDKQSRKLKERFQTEEGQKTRQEISDASRRMQAGDYGARAAEHLRRLNEQPEQRAARAVESKSRWGSGVQREVMAAWRAEHPDEVLAGAAHARKHIRKHFTGLHRKVKQTLIASGLCGFITEHEVGFYSIDEAMPGIRLAVEVDGCWWHGCVTCGHPGVGAIRSCDARKTSYLTNRGWTIIRLAEHDIKADLDGCVQRVQDTVEQLNRSIP